MIATADRRLGNGIIFLADVMDFSLQIVEFRIATVAADQLIMCSVLDDATALDGDDAVSSCARSTNGEQ